MLPHVFAYGMSRSGTTLLTTILDSHPDVSMGYELMTAGITDARAAAEQILDFHPGEPRACSAELESRGLEQLGKLVHRADRALVTPHELADLLRDLADDGHADLDSFDGRVALASAVVALKARKEGTQVTGYKLNAPKIGAFDKRVKGQAAYVFILRDPRDIWRSHIENDFGRTAEAVAHTWTGYLSTFERFARRHPDRTHLVRYEDLVASPTERLDELCAAIGLPRASTMDRFNQSKASVLRGGHANSENLQKDFFTSSVGRFRDELSEQDLETIESICFEGMAAHGYEPVTTVGFRFSTKELKERDRWLAKRRNYFRDEYAGLVLPAVEAFPHLTWAEATARPRDAELTDLLLIRHDIDQDIDNAVRLARWEAERDIRATYCVLHTAWYYGRKEKGRTIRRSQQMVDACLEIQSLGHEINLHNNAVVVGLKTGADPYEVLAEELDFLRSRGLEVTGTSTHGDPLCSRLGFGNLELFSETVYPSRGGARTLEHDGHAVTIGTRSMAEFGLTYEGYDLPRDTYITDSGGRLKVVHDTAGRAGLSRAELEPLPYKRIVGMLTHPVWWNLRKRAPEGRPPVDFATLAPELTQRSARRRLADGLRRATRR